MIKTITLISDTHCKNWKEIHPEIKSKIQQTDYAIHCGDYVHKNILDEFILNSNNPIVVHGNSDPVEIRQLIPYTEILKIEESFRTNLNSWRVRKLTRSSRIILKHIKYISFQF